MAQYMGYPICTLFFDSWGQVMTLLRSVFLLILSWSPYCFSIDSTDFFEAIDSQDAQAAINFFDKIGDIDIAQARESISNIYDYYVSQFGPEILQSEEYCQNLEYFRKLYHSISNQYGISTKNSLIQNKHRGFYRILKWNKIEISQSERFLAQ